MSVSDVDIDISGITEDEFPSKRTDNAMNALVNNNLYQAHTTTLSSDIQMWTISEEERVKYCSVKLIKNTTAFSQWGHYLITVDNT